MNVKWRLLAKDIALAPFRVFRVTIGTAMLTILLLVLLALFGIYLVSKLFSINHAVAFLLERYIKDFYIEDVEFDPDNPPEPLDTYIDVMDWFLEPATEEEGDAGE